MEVSDIRLMSKEQKKSLIDKYSLPFAYVLSQKIKQPIYSAKRSGQLKYFVEYFNVLNSQTFFNLVDINKILPVKKMRGYELINIKDKKIEKEDLEFCEKLLKNAFKKTIKKKIGEFEYIYLENEIYQTDLPFKRNIMVVYHHNRVIASCFVSGLYMLVQEVRGYSKEELNKIINLNSDCRKLSSILDCPYEIMETYLSGRYNKNFIDSVVVNEDYRNKGICTNVYEILFRHYNSKKINLTSCKFDIQSKDAIKLWEGMRDKFPNHFREYNDFYYLDFTK